MVNMLKKYHVRDVARWLLPLLCLCGVAPQSQAQYDMEYLNRGVVAVSLGGSQVFVSWRWMGNESDSVGFNVYRGGTLLNSSPITDRTNYVDNGGSTGATYSVRAVVNGQEQAGSSPVSVWGAQYLRIPLQRPSGGTTPDGVAYEYSPNDASVADLDGDGDYEIVLKWDPSNSKDNSQSGYTGKVYLDAYELTAETVAHRPGLEYSRRRALHPVYGVRFRQRWPRRGGVQNSRWHD